MDSGVPGVQGPAGGPGRSDADPVGPSQRDPAGPGHPVQLPAQDSGAPDESKPHRCCQGRGTGGGGRGRINSDLKLFLFQMLGNAVVGDKMAVEISFTNPLPRVLKAVAFHLEGLGLVTARKISYG